jgi:hypothetical protein
VAATRVGNWIGSRLPAFLRQADDVLRQRPWTTSGVGTLAALGRLIANLVVFGMAYGAVMGTYGGLCGGRTWQLFYSAVKVPMLLMVTFLLGLPSFFVLNTLLGLRRDFFQAVRALVAAQAGLAIVLASLAPFTALYYASFDDYQGAILFNTLMFAAASLVGQWLLRRYYRPLTARNARHRWMLWSWLALYAFVGIQMGWVLRPFIGDPTGPVQFLREESWGNAYEVVFRMIWSRLHRL